MRRGRGDPQGADERDTDQDEDHRVAKAVEPGGPPFRVRHRTGRLLGGGQQTALLTERDLWPATVQEPVDFHLVAGNGAGQRPYADALRRLDWGRCALLAVGLPAMRRSQNEAAS